MQRNNVSEQHNFFAAYLQNEAVFNILFRSMDACFISAFEAEEKGYKNTNIVRLFNDLDKGQPYSFHRELAARFPYYIHANQTRRFIKLLTIASLFDLFNDDGKLHPEIQQVLNTKIESLDGKNKALEKGALAAVYSVIPEEKINLDIYESYYQNIIGEMNGPVRLIDEAKGSIENSLDEDNALFKWTQLSIGPGKIVFSKITQQEMDEAKKIMQELRADCQKDPELSQLMLQDLELIEARKNGFKRTRSAEVKLVEMESSVTSLVDERNALSDTNKALREAVTQEESQVAALKNEIAGLKNELAQRSEQVAELEKRMAEAERQKQLDQEANIDITGRMVTLTQDNLRLKKKAADLDLLNEAESKKSQSLTEAMQAMQRIGQPSVISDKQRLDIQATTIKDLNAKLERAKGELAKLEQTQKEKASAQDLKIDQLNVELKELRLQKSILENDNKALDKAAKSASAAQQKVVELSKMREEALDLLDKTVKSKREEAVRAADHLERVITGHKAESEHHKSEVDKLERIAKVHSDSNAALAAKLAAHEKTVETITLEQNEASARYDQSVRLTNINMAIKTRGMQGALEFVSRHPAQDEFANYYENLHQLISRKIDKKGGVVGGLNERTKLLFDTVHDLLDLAAHEKRHTTDHNKLENLTESLKTVNEAIAYYVIHNTVPPEHVVAIQTAAKKHNSRFANAMLCVVGVFAMILGAGLVGTTIAAGVLSVGAASPAAIAGVAVGSVLFKAGLAMSGFAGVMSVTAGVGLFKLAKTDPITKISDSIANQLDNTVNNYHI